MFLRVHDSQSIPTTGTNHPIYLVIMLSAKAFSRKP
jgi:choline dehydrogenase-like flavoprotein